MLLIFRYWAYLLYLEDYWWLHALKTVTCSSLNKCYILKSYFTTILQRERSLFLWIESILQRNYMEKYSNYSRLSSLLKQYGGAEETHAGCDVTTCGYNIWALWNGLLLMRFGRLSGQILDQILLLIGLAIWLGDLFDNCTKIDSYLNLNLNWNKSYLVREVYRADYIQHIILDKIKAIIQGLWKVQSYYAI